MTDKKLTDEEIIKRLEQCVKCGNRNYDSDIVLDLINRQKADIERLRAKVETRTQEKLALGRIYTQKLKTVKYEAYKEFAERLKKETLSDKGYGRLQQGTIDNLLKEMVGEEK